MRVLSEFSCGQFIQLKPEFATTLFILKKMPSIRGMEKFQRGAVKAKKRVAEKNATFPQSHRMAPSFLSLFLKPSIMPNQGNKSKGQSGIVQKKKQSTTPSTPKKGTAGATKHSRNDNGQSAAGSDSKGGSKSMPDGSAND